MNFKLKKASERIQDDRKTVLAAVKNNGFELEYASARLQDDKEVVLVAVKSYCKSLRFASPRLKDDKEVVLAAIKKSKFSLSLASEKLRSDKEFISQLKFSDVDVFKCCHSSIRKHKDIYLPALKKDPKLCRLFSENDLLTLDFSSLSKESREIIYRSYKRRSKQKDIFLLAKAKRHFLS